MNHLKTCESNYSCWCGPKQVGSATTVKSRDSFFLENFPNAINNTKIPLLHMTSMTLFLKPRAYNLHELEYSRDA